MSKLARQMFIVVAFQFLLVLGLLTYKQITVVTGQRILLKVEPIDPLDPFRGEYVDLGYSFSRLQPGEVQGPSLQRGDILYVALAPQGRFYEKVGVSREVPREATVFLRGTVTQVSAKQIQVTYGIESWFVQKGKGLELEREGRDRDKQLVVEVAVDKRGQAVLRQVHVEPRRTPASPPVAAEAPRAPAKRPRP